MKQLSIPTPIHQSFQFKKQEVRTELIDHEVWWCLADVTEALDIKRGSRTIDRLSPKGVRKTYTLTNGGKQELLFINESNLYKLIFRSNKPEARAFEDWVTGEVLPSIRKTGSYSTQPQLDTLLTVEQRKQISAAVAIASQHSHYTRQECWQLLHAKFDIASITELRASQYDAAVSWLESLNAGTAKPVDPPPQSEADFITRQALAGTSAFSVRITVDEPVGRQAKLIKREFRANIYILEEKPKHEIAAYIDAMTDAHQKRLRKAGIA